MQIQTQHAPAATIAVCQLNAGETLIAEGGSLLGYRGSLSLTTTTQQKKSGGLVSGFKRMLSGESFFLNHFTANEPATVWLGTPLPGDIVVLELKNEKLIIQSGCYVANTPDVEINLEWQGLKSVFSGEGLFWVKATGSGLVILNSFGFIYPIKVNGEYVVDTGHIVAFEETLQFRISKASRSILQSMLGGEGFVTRFTGTGTVWCQSHNSRSFGLELRPQLRVKQG